MNKINSYIENSKDDMVKMLGSLIEIPSVKSDSKPGMPFGENNAKVLEKTLKICEDFGLKVKNFDNYVGTADWGDDPQLGILMHLDVVPAGEGWSTDPFTPVIKDGSVFGRGAIDDKGPAVSALFALLAVMKSGAKPKGGVRLIFGTDEECGSSDIAYYKKIEKMPPMLFTPDGSYPVINIEKGMVRLGFNASFKCLDDNSAKLLEIHGGHVANAVPGTATALVSKITKSELEEIVASVKTNCSFSINGKGENTEIVCKGISAHASLPGQGENALTALLLVLSKTSIKNEGMDSIREIYKSFPYGDSSGQACGIACKDEKSGELTLTFSMLDGSCCEFCGVIDVRFPLCTSLDEVIGGLKKALEPSKVNTEVTLGAEPHEADGGSDFVKTLLKSYEEVTGEKGECLAIGGGTYVHELDGVAFGVEFPGKDYHMHGADEFIPIDELIINAKIFAKAISSLAAE